MEIENEDVDVQVTFNTTIIADTDRVQDAIEHIRKTIQNLVIKDESGGTTIHANPSPYYVEVSDTVLTRIKDGDWMEGA